MASPKCKEDGKAIASTKEKKESYDQWDKDDYYLLNHLGINWSASTVWESRPKLAGLTDRSVFTLYISVGQTKAMLATFRDEFRIKSMEQHSRDWLTVAHSSARLLRRDFPFRVPVVKLTRPLIMLTEPRARNPDKRSENLLLLKNLFEVQILGIQLEGQWQKAWKVFFFTKTNLRKSAFFRF